MRWGIRNQLLVPLLTLLLGAAGVCTLTALRSAQQARHQIEIQVRNVARTLCESDFRLTQRVLEQMKGLSGAEYLLNSRKGPALATLPVAGVQLPDPDFSAGEGHLLHLGPPIDIGGDRYLCTGIRLPQPRTDAGDALYILYSEARLRDARWEAVRPSLTAGLLIGAVSLALALVASQRLSGRVQELERRTRVIAGGDFSPMPLPARNDELRDLGRSINEMAQRLAQLQEAVKKNERLRLLGQVSGGLAHQLRNSATGARLAVQLHARDCTGADREALEVALRQLALMEASLRRFLDLGKAGKPGLAPCDLLQVLDEVAALLQPQCLHGRVQLNWSRPEGKLLLRADPAQLQHLFLNLVGNAMEAAGAGGWVRVQATSLACDQVTIEVSDSGPGPCPEVASRLFEPFVTGKREGVGLGLAVARQITETHGGRIGWRRDENATCFWVQFSLVRPHCEPDPGS